MTKGIVDKKIEFSVIVQIDINDGKPTSLAV